MSATAMKFRKRDVAQMAAALEQVAALHEAVQQAICDGRIPHATAKQLLPAIQTNAAACAAFVEAFKRGTVVPDELAQTEN